MDEGLLGFVPDGKYVVKSFATDTERNSVCAYGVFSGTHTGQGGPCPPTGKRVSSDYVYVMEFEGDKIRHMTKIWNAGWAMRELGWVRLGEVERVRRREVNHGGFRRDVESNSRWVQRT